MRSQFGDRHKRNIMDYEKYKNTLDCPAKPSKPKEPKLIGHDASAYRTHADAMDKYAKDLEAYENGPHKEWKALCDIYHKEDARLQDLFKTDLLEELGITGHPKADQFYAKCYERNHSGGFSDIGSIAHDLIDLMFYNIIEMDELIKFRARNGIRN